MMQKSETKPFPRLQKSTLLLLLAIVILLWSVRSWKSSSPVAAVSKARVEAFSHVVGAQEGRVVQMGPEVGDLVRKGDFLFSLDTELLRLKQNHVQLAMKNLSEEIRLEKMRLDRAMQEYTNATMQADLGLEISDRIQKQLVHVEDAQLKKERWEKKLSLLHAELAILEKEEKNMRWEAPFDGVVLGKFSHEGATVSFGDPLYLLYDPARMWIEAEVLETKMGHVQTGDSVQVTFPAFPGKEFTGKIFFLSPVAKEGKFSMKISIENAPKDLKPGLSAEVLLQSPL